MPEWNSLEEEEDESTISLDDLESLEHNREHESDTPLDEDDWGDSYDDLDSEAWERQYNHEYEGEMDKDPWDLD